MDRGGPAGEIRAERSTQVEAAVEAWLAEGCPVTLADGATSILVDVGPMNIMDWTAIGMRLNAKPTKLTQDIIDATNKRRTLTRADYLALVDAVGDALELIRFWRRDTLDAIAAASTVADILAIDITAPEGV